MLPPDSEPLLTLAEVAAMFRVNPRTVTRWAREGRLTSIRTPGGHRRYREAEVRALLVATRVVAAPLVTGQVATSAHPYTAGMREDLKGQRHTVTVERLSISTARQLGRDDLRNQLAVIERQKGRLIAVLCVQSELADGSTIDGAAAGYAAKHQAEYVAYTTEETS